MNTEIVCLYGLFLVFCLWLLKQGIFEYFVGDTSEGGKTYTEDFNDLSSKQWLGLKIKNNGFIHWHVIKFYDENGTLIDNSGFTSTQSSTLTDGEIERTANMILDNDMTSYQHTNNTVDEWLLIDFNNPEGINLSKIEVFPRSNANSVTTAQERYKNQKFYLYAADNSIMEYPLYKSENNGFDIKNEIGGYLIPGGTQGRFLKWSASPSPDTKWLIKDIPDKPNGFRIEHKQTGLSIKCKSGGWNMSANETSLGFLNTNGADGSEGVNWFPYLFDYNLDATGTAPNTTRPEKDFYEIQFVQFVSDDIPYYNIKFNVPSSVYSGKNQHVLGYQNSQNSYSHFATSEMADIANDTSDPVNGIKKFHFSLIDSNSNWNREPTGEYKFPLQLTLDNNTIWKTQPTLVVSSDPIVDAASAQAEYTQLKADYLANLANLNDTNKATAISRMRDLKVVIAGLQGVQTNIQSSLDTFMTKYNAQPAETTNSTKLFNVLNDPEMVTSIQTTAALFTEGDGVTSTQVNQYLDPDIDLLDAKNNMMFIYMTFSTIANENPQNAITLLNTYNDTLVSIFGWEQSVFNEAYAGQQDVIDLHTALVDLFTADINGYEPATLYSQMTDIQKTHVFDEWFKQTDAETITGKLTFQHQKNIIGGMPAKSIVGSFNNTKTKEVIQEIPGTSLGIFGKIVGGIF